MGQEITIGITTEIYEHLETLFIRISTNLNSDFHNEQI